MLWFFGTEAWEPRRVKPVGFTISGAPNSQGERGCPVKRSRYFFPDLLFAVLLLAAGFFAVVFLAAVVFFAPVLLAAGFFAAVVFFAPPVLLVAGFLAMLASSLRVDFALEPSRARSGSK